MLNLWRQVNKTCRDMTPLYSRLTDAAHVWVLKVENSNDKTLTRDILGILNRQERERYERFHFDRDRHLFLSAHGLKRLVLSRYFDCAPDEWVFEANQNGRPEIAAPLSAVNQLRVNLTHTRGLAACVVTAQIACGIDAEHRHSLNDLQTLSESVLHQSELCVFRALPASDRLNRFFDFWVVKEACAKACGRGLSLPLRKLSIEFSRCWTQPSVHKAPDNLHWQTSLMHPTSGHHLAVAVETAEPVDVSVMWMSASLRSLIANRDA